MQSEYVERLHEWLKLVIVEDYIDQIYSMKISLNSEEQVNVRRFIEWYFNTISYTFNIYNIISFNSHTYFSYLLYCDISDYKYTLY